MSERGYKIVDGYIVGAGIKDSATAAEVWLFARIATLDAEIDALRKELLDEHKALARARGDA